MKAPASADAGGKLRFSELVDLGGRGRGRRSMPWMVDVKETAAIDMRCMSEMATFCEEVRPAQQQQPHHSSSRCGAHVLPRMHTRQAGGVW